MLGAGSAFLTHVCILPCPSARFSVVLLFNSCLASYTEHSPALWCYTLTWFKCPTGGHFFCLMCTHLPRHPSLSSWQGWWWWVHKWMCDAGGGVCSRPYQSSIHYSVGVHMVGDVIRELIAFLLWENGCVIMKSSAMNQWDWGEAPLLMGPGGAIDWWPCVCAW